MAASSKSAGEDLSKLNPAGKRMHAVAEEYWEKRAHGPAAEDAGVNSVLQQMMDAAFASKDEDDAAARAERAKDAETSFATGFKKGFLLSKPTKTQAKPAAAKPAPAPASTPSSAAKQPITSPSGAEPGVVEVGADGTFDVPDAPPPAPAPAVPTLRASPEASKAGLAMPEVQAAMKEKLGAFGEQLASGSWMTPDLQQRIFSNPRLMAGMANPKCMAALQEFQAKPEAAMAKYAADPCVVRLPPSESSPAAGSPPRESRAD